MIKITGLSKAYKEGGRERLLFEDVDLTLPSKGLISLFGKSGTGKSTFLHLLSAMERPSEGKIEVNGIDIVSMSDASSVDFRRSECGFLFQSHHLQGNMTASENAMMPLLLNGHSRSYADKEASKAFDELGIAYLKDRPASELSGGERARVAFVRASIHSPPILLCDEPTGALDDDNGRLLMGILKKYSENALVMVVTHSSSLMKLYSDGILSLKGRAISWVKEPRFMETEVRPEVGRTPKKDCLLRFLAGKAAASRMKKGIPLFLALCFMFLGVFSSLALYNGGESLLKGGADRSLLYCSASVSETESIDISDANVRLSRSKRPSKKALLDLYSDFPSLEIGNDFGYFFPQSLPYVDHGYPSDPVSFCPVWDITLSDREGNLLLEGEIPTGDTLDYVLINEAMAKTLREEAVGSIIDVTSDSAIQNGDESLDVRLSFSFTVAGVVDDFAFLSSPRVFYSYPAFSKRMEGIEVGDKSLFEWVDQADGSSELSSYGYWLFFSEMDASKIREACESDLYALSNALWSAQEGFLSVWRILEAAAIPFLAVQMCIVIFSLVALAQKRFMENRGFFVLLKALGMKEEKRIWLFEWDYFAVTMASMATALLLSFPVSSLLSRFLEGRFGLENLASLPLESWFGIPYALPLGALAFGLLIFLLASHLPMKLESRKCLATELKDE